jgi:hypothetical protein
MLHFGTGAPQDLKEAVKQYEFATTVLHSTT